MSDFTSIKQWLKSTEDEPLETMSGFFDRRVDSYEDHMRPWRAYYRWLGELIPAQAETLLDLGCGTGLELDEIFRLHPDIRVTGIDLAPGMLALVAAGVFYYVFNYVVAFAMEKWEQALRYYR